MKVFQLGAGFSDWCECFSLVFVFQLGLGVSAWCECFDNQCVMFHLGCLRLDVWSMTIDM